MSIFKVLSLAKKSLAFLAKDNTIRNSLAELGPAIMETKEFSIYPFLDHFEREEVNKSINLLIRFPAVSTIFYINCLFYELIYYAFLLQ